MYHELWKAYARKHTSPRRVIKIDLPKAYDSIEWIFLKQVLRTLGFPEKFTEWVMQCVRTVNYTIMINGQPSTETFNAASGIKQGDPINPSLTFPWNTSVEC